MNLNVNFSFTADTKGFWDGFWERNDGLGSGKTDPDSKSATMRAFHKVLWSKQLPNGEFMELEDGKSRFYLRWRDMYFGSDSITASFRYYRNKPFLDDLSKAIPNYKGFVEDYLHLLYTIGGEMIFPQFSMGINQSRGCNMRICDRWDLTLECIKRYYEGVESPLTKALEKNKEFFALFVNFNGFVEFFLLQDCIDNNGNVIMWLNTELFVSNPIPKDYESYLAFILKEMEFVDKRNKRIERYLRQPNIRM
ncbi:MAG: hypothetical protein MJZ69_07670 [Bacteroidaceae bacterium]|nr:hypothetical protein [Bacteroidaceae bacterium]